MFLYMREGGPTGSGEYFTNDTEPIELGVESERAELEEGRYGDEPLIVRIMEKGEAKVLGPISEHVRDIGPHTNRVDLAEVVLAEEVYKYKSSNLTEFIEIVDEKSGLKIKCVFKPSSGESQELKQEHGLHSFYQR